MRCVGATLLLLAAIAPAHAQQNCHDGHVASDPASLRPGVVIGKQPRTHFYSGIDKRADCPGAGAACRSKAYVVKGDKVIVAPDEEAPGLVCAGFVNRKGVITAGWLPADAVAVQPAPKPSIAGWLGKWRYGNSNIAIKRGKTPGTLDLEGDSWSKRYQSVNTGDLSAEGIKPEGNVLAFAHSAGEIVPIEKADKIDCVIRFALVHDVMVAEDNGNCGGAGVYFGGFYRRKR